VRDALRLDALADAGLRFQTVVDSAMFHVIGDAEPTCWSPGSVQ
jgi:hypothetical protein